MSTGGNAEKEGKAEGAGLGRRPIEHPPVGISTQIIWTVGLTVDRHRRASHERKAAVGGSYVTPMLPVSEPSLSAP